MPLWQLRITRSSAPADTFMAAASDVPATSPGLLWQGMLLLKNQATTSPPRLFAKALFLFREPVIA